MKKLFVTLLAIVMMMNSNVFAMDISFEDEATFLDLSKDSLKFLIDRNVDMNIFDDVMGEPTLLYNNTEKNISYNRSYEQIVQSVKAEAKAYNFSDDQVEQLINSAIHTPISFYVPEEADASVRCIDPISTNRNPLKDDGVGYEVLSLAGYHTTTAFATLPEVYTGSEYDGRDVNAFMFWTINETIDIGITYSTGTYGEKWRICWLYPNGELQVPDASEDIPRLQEVRNIYFRTTVIDDEWVRMEIINANNFNETIKAFCVGTKDLGITRSNAKWRRQITLCTSDKVGTTVVFDGGAYLEGAEFSQCHIYAGTETSGVTAEIDENYVDEEYCGRFGLDNTSRNYVDVEAHTHWSSEKINIYYPQ